MTSHTTTLSKLIQYNDSNDPHNKKLFTWLLAAATASTVAAGLWWLSKESYYSYVPLRYQYRPGTISAWVSSMLAKHAKRRRSRRPIRVYMDGCFDLMHYGHANALRQAKTLGDELVVGLVPDSEILRCKGPPLMNEEERLEMVESVKWVDEVLTGVPYDLTPAFLEELIHKHKIDYVIHGDDPCLLPDGTDAYEYAKKAGRFRMIKRTEGVSTTDIVGRMLMCSRVNSRFTEEALTTRLTKEFSMGRAGSSFSFDSTSSSELNDIVENFQKERDSNSAFALAAVEGDEGAPHQQLPNGSLAAAGASPPRSRPIPISSTTQPSDGTTQDVSSIATAASSVLGATPSSAPRKAIGGNDSHRPITVSRFMPTSHRIVQFSSGKFAPRGAKIIYIDGAFDLFHEGHVKVLKKAKEQGDFLLVGIHTDEEVTERRGPHLPIMGLHERALSVLACRFADEVIIGAPQVITEDLLITFGINLVVRGSVHETAHRSSTSEAERYKVPRQRGIFQNIPSPSSMTSATLIQRIVKNRTMFEERQSKKVRSEAAYYATSKQYVDEV